MFHSTEGNRTTSYEKLLDYANSRLRDKVYCCRTLVSNSETLGTTDAYFGGAFLVKFLADQFGLDIHVDLLKSDQPTFAEALAEELASRGSTVAEAFDSFQRWFEEKRPSRNDGGGIGGPLQSEAFTLNFAHFANGGGITSDLVFVNAGSAPVRPALYFYDTGGNPIAAETVVDITGDLEVAEDGGLTGLTEMEPLGELTISTHGRGDLGTGSIMVMAAGPIGGVLRFDIPDIGVAGVGDSRQVRDAIFPVRRQAGGINTGVAIRNQGEATLLVRCHLMQAGAVLDEEIISLPPRGQIAQFIDETFPGTDTSNFAGSVRCATRDPGFFSAMALELDAVNRIFTTLPVVPLSWP